MSRTRLYATDAEKQAAYRARHKQRVQAVLEGRRPPPPSIGTMPSETRWKALASEAKQTLETLHREMQDYYDARSEQWQEGDRGLEFQERIDQVSELIDSFDTIQG